MVSRVWVVPGLALALSACASVPAPVTRSPLNPAHPEAPEAVTAPLAPGLMPSVEPVPSPSPLASGHSGHSVPAAERGGGHEQQEPTAGPTTSAGSYTCPMHPDVTGDKGGTCPRCGMALVPKKPHQDREP